MNVQDKQQRQGQPTGVTGTDAGVQAADTARTEQVTQSEVGVKEAAEEKAAIIARDYEKAMSVSASLQNVEVDELKRRGRGESAVLGRMIVAWWLNEIQEYNCHDISRVFCRDRSTVYYYCRRFKELMQIRDKKVIRLYNEFMDKINKSDNENE